jgi:hypothetical protein
VYPSRLARLLPFAVAVAVVAGYADGVAAESYDVSAESALTIDREGRLSQSWTATCVAADAAADAVISSAGKDLRFVESLEEPLEQGIDADTYDVDEPAGGRYVYALVPGARVLARLKVRCGSDEVFDEVTVDSAPVTVAPQLSPPSRIVDADTLNAVGPDAVPVGSTIELVGIVVGGSPRGSETIDVHILGGGVDQTVTLGQEDFADGRATLSPQLSLTSVGQVTIEASLAGAVSSPFSLTVVPFDEAPPPGTGDDTLSTGCASTRGPQGSLLLGLLAGVVLSLRRR